MQVQINELIIRTTVDSSGSAPAPAASGSGISIAGPSEAELAAIVLEIIKEKKER